MWRRFYVRWRRRGGDRLEGFGSLLAATRDCEVFERREFVAATGAAAA